LIIGDDLNVPAFYKDPFLKENNIIVKHFPDIQFDSHFLEIQKKLERPSFLYDRRFQLHKFHVFDIYFKKWDYVFYIDCGMYIYSDIHPILQLKEPNILFANRDGIDGEEWMESGDRISGSIVGDGIGQAMKLHSQFVKLEPYYSELKMSYDLFKNCFQTGFLLYDTRIINSNTFSDLLQLLHKYPISRTNEQGIMALYFTQIKPCWKQLPRKVNDKYTYDMVKCVRDDYIMIKYPATVCELDRGYFATYTGQVV